MYIYTYTLHFNSIFNIKKKLLISHTYLFKNNIILKEVIKKNIIYILIKEKKNSNTSILCNKFHTCI